MKIMKHLKFFCEAHERNPTHYNAENHYNIIHDLDQLLLDKKYIDVDSVFDFISNNECLLKNIDIMYGVISTAYIDRKHLLIYWDLFNKFKESLMNQFTEEEVDSFLSGFKDE